MIARAMMTRPRLLILDEPTAGVGHRDPPRHVEDRCAKSTPPAPR
jgi:ABC-type molybdenum transport system ATPase subunit/photorepair protein PhrA